MLIAVAAFTAFVALTWAFLSLEYLKQSQSMLAGLVGREPLALAAAYFAIYVAATALSFPGAAILTLAGGALFGLVWGTVIVSFASSLGATLAFLAARYVLRDSVQRRFGQRLAEIDRGIDKDGAFYLFTLRLIPVVPFFLINLLMGGKIRTEPSTFEPARILAGTGFREAETQLARIDSLQGLVAGGAGQRRVVLLFPLMARSIVKSPAEQFYAPWRSVPRTNSTATWS